MSDDPLSREARIEEFGEQQVAHTEWWSDEMGRVDDVRADLLESIREREDCQLAKTGTSVDRDGRRAVGPGR